MAGAPGGAQFDEVEWLLRTDAAGVRINALGPGRATPWHRHAEVADDVFCLEAPIEIGLRGPDETVALSPGQRLHIAAGRVHRVGNPGAAPARYLLVQVGRYDFQRVDEEP